MSQDNHQASKEQTASSITSHQPPMNRRDFMSSSLTAGLGFMGIGAITHLHPSAVGAARPLTPTFYQWINDIHPGLPRVNRRFPGINYQIAPVQGFGIERFVAEARKGKSTWDVYVGQTPFNEMMALIKSGVIEPWDNYIPREVIDDIIPAIRAECSVDGKLYSWPFLLDVIGMGWHSGITSRAGISGPPPLTWDDYLHNARTVIDSEAAPFGATFDAHGWRSLAPFTHSLTSDVYTTDGLFDFTHEACVEAMILMKKIMAMSNPDILLAGSSDGGVNDTPDEGAFAAQRVAYYTKYFSAALRMAHQGWEDPTEVALAPLPKFSGGEGSTVFWSTGCALLKHGQNKEEAAEYIRSLTYDGPFWKDSIAGNETSWPGQLPPYSSIYSDWEANRPDWLPDFIGPVREQFNQARAIENHLFGLQQFFIAQPFCETYLKGVEPNPRVALHNASVAVQSEIQRS